MNFAVANFNLREKGLDCSKGPAATAGTFFMAGKEETFRLSNDILIKH